ncbi:peroxisome assembly protein 12-like [Dendronephthya gigantea]|uniref:peroxisome assembly protein 12-like n=1 Tax=Dendronephthya gigantea TaxID=151771 RepID=UPI00106D7851|nr:peroxisome assembly protein 12-like [Dendronephthya gigantea]
MSEEASSSTKVTFSKPSIFEIVAHQAVASVFKPACQYVIRILAQKYPEKLAHILKYSDEIYMVCDLVLQRHYLSCYNASLSENFYYLKRINVANGVGERLGKKLQYLSLIALVLWPYMKCKVDQAFEKLRDKIIREEDDGQSSRNKLFLLFLTLYPLVHFTIQSISAIYQMGYTLKLLNYHTPVFHALQMQLVRASSEDLLGFHTDLFTGSKSLWQRFLSIPGFLLDKMIKFVTVIMPAVIFFLQFVEWWYSTDHEITSSVVNLPIPPPPEMPKISKHGCGLPPHPLQCPLCHKVHTNMATLVSSGFVFCYPCIHQFITEHGCCPVTNIPSSLDQILRIYSLQDS